LSGFKEKPKKIFLVHGEEEAKKSFANTAKNTLGFDCTVVEDVSEYDLDNETVMVDGIKNRIDTKNQINKLKDNLDDIHNELGNLLAIPGIGIKGSFLDEKREDLAVLTRDLEKTCEKLKTVINK
jgi:hypothetical protein